jgi:hypothetical protein
LLTHLLAKRQIHVIIGEDNLKKDVFIDIAECSFIALLHEFESINYPLREYFNIQINLSSKDIPEPIGYSNLSGTTEDNQTDVNFSGEDNSDGESRNMIVWHIDDAIFNFDDEAGRDSWVAGGKKVSFEFDPSNSDDGGDALFDDPSAASQYFELNTNNSVLQIIEEADCVRISAWIDIALTLKDGIDEDEFYDWANNYGGVYCSTITLNDCDSSISGDSGQEFRWNSNGEKLVNQPINGDSENNSKTSGENKMSALKIEVENVSYDFHGYIAADDGFVSSIVLYIVFSKSDRNILFGAYYGAVGGGENDGGFFLIDIENGSSKHLDYDEVDGHSQAGFFDLVMKALWTLIDDNEGDLILSDEGSKHYAPDNDGIWIDAEFDGDSLDEVSKLWKILLRFES